MSNVIEIMKGKDIISYDYTIDHDGYDEDGPESDLYDIFLVVKEDNMNVCYIFHVENWYTGNPDIAIFEEEIPLTEDYFVSLYCDYLDMNVDSTIRWTPRHKFVRSTFSEFVK
jgi:hypothetical protein